MYRSKIKLFIVDLKLAKRALGIAAPTRRSPPIHQRPTRLPVLAKPVAQFPMQNVVADFAAVEATFAVCPLNQLNCNGFIKSWFLIYFVQVPDQISVAQPIGANPNGASAIRQHLQRLVLSNSMLFYTPFSFTSLMSNTQRA